MMRYLALIWMVSYLFVRRTLCTHKWETTKEGFIKTLLNSDRYVAAELQVCRHCGAVSCVSVLKGHKRVVGLSKVQPLFISDRYEPGDEVFDTFKIEVEVFGEFATLLSGYTKRGIAEHEMREIRARYSDMVVRVTPDRRNVWHTLSHPL